MRIPYLVVIALLACAFSSGGTAFADPSGQVHPRGVWPLDPRPAVLAEFAPPAEKWGAGHRGVDLDGSAGQVVRAALPGTISFAGSIAGRGVVVVDHGETRTTYEPVVASVAVGDSVAAGGVIGRLTVNGSHCLPATCLHWGWLRGEVYLNPLDLVGAARVRLLPLFGLGVAPGQDASSGLGGVVGSGSGVGLGVGSS